MNTKYGFTMIELLIVFSILSILAVMLLVVVDPLAQFQKAHDAKRKSDLSQVQKALEQYYQDNGKYPKSNVNYQILDSSGQAVNWGTSWQPYIELLPKDPIAARTYIYYSPAPDYQWYLLYAALERGKYDSQACNNGNACTSLGNNGISDTACGDTCNFALTSPNVSP